MGFFRALSFDRWPSDDQVRWQNAIQEADVLNQNAVAANWRPRTKQTVYDAYAYALDWLASNGLLDPQKTPMERWTASVLARYIETLRQHVASATVKHRILNLERALVVLDPGKDSSLFRKAVTELEKSVVHKAKRHRLKTSAELEGLGRDLMNMARDHADQNCRKNAARYRDGLQIGLLARRPLRKRNFASIEIGRHLIREGDGWRLYFPEIETKNHQEIDVPVPSELAPALETYLEYYRPLLSGIRYSGARLWVTYRYGPQTPHSLQLTISQRTEAAFGKPINPHLFRDSAATSLAIEDPEHVRVAAAVLGHRSFATTEKHYNLAQTTDAAQKTNSVIALLKKRLAR